MLSSPEPPLLAGSSMAWVTFGMALGERQFVSKQSSAAVSIAATAQAVSFVRRIVVADVERGKGSVTPSAWKGGENEELRGQLEHGRLSDAEMKRTGQKRILLLSWREGLGLAF
jgi:hypothetical protein